jgi:hypothetical protein
MMAADLREWIKRSRAAQGLPAKATASETARTIGVVTPTNPSAGDRHAA